MELAPRDIIARALITEMNEGHGIFREASEMTHLLLALRRLGEERIDERLPRIKVPAIKRLTINRRTSLYRCGSAAPDERAGASHIEIVDVGDYPPYRIRTQRSDCAAERVEDSNLEPAARRLRGARDPELMGSRFPAKAAISDQISHIYYTQALGRKRTVC